MIVSGQMFGEEEVADVVGPTVNLPKISPTDKTVVVLAVSPFKEDHACLRSIFSHSNWKIHQARDCHEALEILQDKPMAVVVCERDLPDGNWKKLLECLSSVTPPPLLVVTSIHADESLWAEALNLGAYDVLSKPFDSAEVTRIISLAWLQWKEQTMRVLQRPAASSVSVGTPGSLSATA